jgi:murein L,D-transpeptidase YcbB/YkuD
MCRPKDIFLILFSLLIFLAGSSPLPVFSAEQRLDYLIQKRLLSAGDPAEILIRGESLRAPDLIADFYKKRKYQPAWIDVKRPLKGVFPIVDAISNVDREGLSPDYYHSQSINKLIKEISEALKNDKNASPGNLVDLDLLLSDAFLLIGCHYSAGCVNPVTIETKWFAQPGELDISSIFENAVRKKAVAESLENLLPSQDMYGKLKKNLMAYRKLAAQGGWPEMPDGTLLGKGDQDKRIVQLKKRLIVSGYLPPTVAEPTPLFDNMLEEAILRFQRLHGLVTDGIVGPNTLKALNVSATKRVRQIELNMERLRWVSRKLGKRYILVNVADFTLDVIDHDYKVLSMKVVVGKPYWHTPVFSDQMTYLVLNPYWNVPKSIAGDEVLPKVQKNPEYLYEQNMKVISGWGEKAEEIDLASIVWDDMNAETFKYRFRQEPGPKNPLGRIKFMFPNDFGVYLHDTTNKRLFERTVRVFSHGCIRLEKPLDLAEYVLRNDPKWTREKIQSEIDTETMREVRLPEPINIHILYLTAWVDEDGLLHFRNDIYGRDAKLDEALRTGHLKKTSSTVDSHDSE